MKSEPSNSVPKVSVILSVRNGEIYLREAIESILNQSFEDFELIIVDNHSTDSSAKIVESYDDARIILTKPEEPLHLAQALNHAASMARGKFVARMDADDVSHPSRFEKQVAYLQEHSEVGILGSQIRPIDGGGNLITRGSYHKPESHADIACSLFFGCPLWHPTVMLRKSEIDELGWYSSPTIAGREQYSTEDYDLWCRAITQTQIHNLSEVLLDYRIHADNHSLGSAIRKENLRNIVLILSQHIKASLGMNVSDTTCALILGLKPGDVAEADDVAPDPSELVKLTRGILARAIKDRVSADSMHRLRDKLTTALETGIWLRGFNIMRESIGLLRADWRMCVRVLLRSIRRFL